MTKKKIFSLEKQQEKSNFLMSNQFLLILPLCLYLGSCSFGPTKNSRDLLSKNDLATTERGPNTEMPPQLLDNIQNPGNIRFEWPVVDARMTRGFLPQKRRPHLGIDLAANKGTPILASHSGMVLYAGRDFKGYGRMVLIESGSGWATLYAHLDKILVEEGQMVTPDEIIGQMGRTGRATGVHLHFEIRKNKGPIDPLELLPGGTQVAKHASR